MKLTLASVIDADTLKAALDNDAAYTRLITDSAQRNYAFETMKRLVREKLWMEFSARIFTSYNKLVERYGLLTDATPKPQRDAWYEACDEIITDAIEPWQDNLSAHWQATAVDVRLNEAGAVDKLTGSFADEMWRSLLTVGGLPQGISAKQMRQMIENKDVPEVRELKPGQALAAIGMVWDGDAVETYIPPPAKQEPLAMRSINETVINLHGALGLCVHASNPAGYIDDLESASDSDDVLSGSAIERLGGDMDDVAALRAWRKATGADDLAAFQKLYADHIVTGKGVPPVTPAADPLAAFNFGAPPPPAAPKPAMDPNATDPNAYIYKHPTIPPAAAPVSDPFAAFNFGAATAATPPAPPPPPPANAAPAAAPAKPAGRKQRSTEPTAPKANQIPATALAGLKTTLGMGDDDFVQIFGVSRATVNNWMKGKGECIATAEQRDKLLALIDDRRASLDTHRREIEISVVG